MLISLVSGLGTTSNNSIKMGPIVSYTSRLPHTHPQQATSGKDRHQLRDGPQPRQDAYGALCERYVLPFTT